jgi:hypothetical protein
MNDPLRAAVLVGAMSIEPQPLDPLALRVQAIRRFVYQGGGPLDLDGAYFRYRVEADGSVYALGPIPGARVCREKSGRRRARSVARS